MMFAVTVPCNSNTQNCDFLAPMAQIYGVQICRLSMIHNYSQTPRPEQVLWFVPLPKYGSRCNSMHRPHLMQRQRLVGVQLFPNLVLSWVVGLRYTKY